MDLWAAVGLGVVMGVAAAPWFPADPSVALGVLVVCAALWLMRANRFTRLSAGVALGWLVVCSQPQGPRLRGPVSLSGVVVGAPNGGWAMVEGVRSAPLGGAWKTHTGRVAVRVPRGTRLAPGDELAVFGEASAVYGRVFPGAPDRSRNLQRIGVQSQLRVHTMRVVGSTPTESTLPPILAALATGDRRGVPEEDLAVLRRTGTAHLLAISGFHVGLVSWLIAAGIASTLALSGRWLPTGLPEGGMAAIPGVVALVFTMSVGAPVSAQRATVLVALLGVARAGGRHVRPEAFLGIAATLVLVADPSAIGTPSFQLSFGAVLGLLTWGPALQRLLPPDLRLSPTISSGFIASLAATMGTLPASAWWFQSLSAVGLVTNLFAVPWTIGLVWSALGAAYLPEPLAAVASWIGEHGAWLLLAALRCFDMAPLTPAVGGLGALVCCGVYGIRKSSSLATAGLLLGLCLRPAPQSFRMTVLDVGQGSAVVLEKPSGDVWLVDGGYPNREVLGWLRRQGLHRLAVVAASHGDLDHTGGLGPVLEHLKVEELRLAGADGLEDLKAIAHRRGIPITDDPSTRLAPQALTGLSRNEDSVVLDAEADGIRVLLPGDIGPEAVDDLTDWVGEVDVLLLPHHGSADTTDAFLDATRPRLAIASAGFDNRYGHPADTVVDRLARRGIPLLRTDLMGTLQVRARPTLAWRSFQGGRGWSTWEEVSPRPRDHVAVRTTGPPR